MTHPTVGRDAEPGLLDALFSQAPVGLAFWDADLRCLCVNGFLAEMTGVPAHEHLGRHATEVLPEMGERLAEVLQATLTTARPRAGAELSGRLPADPGTTHHWLVSTYAVPGDPVRVGAVITDVSQRTRVEKEHRRLLLQAREARERAEAAEGRSVLLASAGKLLSGSPDPRVSLAAVVRLAVPQLADWCSVGLLAPDGFLHTLAGATLDAEHEARIAGVLATGRPLLLERAEPVVAVPLRARGRVLGALVLGSAGAGRSFDAEDLETAQELADRCALAVDEMAPGGAREEFRAP